MIYDPPGPDRNRLADRGRGRIGTGWPGRR